MKLIKCNHRGDSAGQTLDAFTAHVFLHYSCLRVAPSCCSQMVWVKKALKQLSKRMQLMNAEQEAPSEAHEEMAGGQKFQLVTFVLIRIFEKNLKFLT